MILLVLALGLVVGTQTSIVQKEGVCPFVHPWCHFPPQDKRPPTNCLTDSDCPGVAKCCATQSCGGRECVTDLLVKVVRPGQCPPGVVGPIICDAFSCSEDAHCPENHKCCSHGCGSECVDTSKPMVPECPWGLCPWPLFEQLIAGEFENSTCAKCWNSERWETEDFEISKCPECTMDCGLCIEYQPHYRWLKGGCREYERCRSIVQIWRPSV